ncbi:MAG TPA: hypothetical protein VGJ91_24710, partial [Polyangiaceae bacterium]
MRHLALPAICLVVVGGLAGWFGRSAFLTWLLKHTADTPIIGPPTPQALDRSLLELALGFGVMLALPLLWWQACTLLTPATIERVKSRLAAYLCVSFALLFANPVTVLVQTSERGSVDLSATQDRLVCASSAEPVGGPVKCSRALPVNEYVSGFSFAFLGCAWVASLLTPIF